ncbi:MAG TPA: hypothetical protein VIK94_03195 [Bacilli bacterium]
MMLARFYNTFEFIGNIHIPSGDKFHKITTSEKGWEGHRLTFAVQESKTNSIFVEMFGGYFKSKPNNIITFSKGTENNPGSKIEIPWEDRLKPETIDMVADFRKTVVDFTTDSDVKKKLNELRYEIRNLEFKDSLTEQEKNKLIDLKNEYKELAKDRREFIHDFDAIVYLKTFLPIHKDRKFRVTGRVEFSEDKGKFYRRFKPELIEIVDDETPSKLRAKMDIFFTSDSFDEQDFEKEKKYYINGYLLSYDSKAKKDQFFPQQFVINAQKVDFNNELHVKRLKYLKNQFTKAKKNKVYHLLWEVNVFRGAERVEITLDDLTPQQREAIELGFNKLEDFIPREGMFGESIYENRLIKPILERVNNDNDFTEGPIETDYTLEDLEFTRTENKEKETINNEEIKEDENINIELDNLFG